MDEKNEAFLPSCVSGETGGQAPLREMSSQEMEARHRDQTTHGHTGTQGFRLRWEAGTERPPCENPNQLSTQVESQQPDSEAQSRKGEGAGGRSPGSQLLGLTGSRATSPHGSVTPSPGQGWPKAAADGRRCLAWRVHGPAAGCQEALLLQSRAAGRADGLQRECEQGSRGRRAL